MTTMTSTIRGSPAIVATSTQNTAPVYEFRCLFTHDLRKKKKIWHDGSLRFHTFNRRVMVYDDSKNYIGDAHWREEGEFLEGEELKLDKGVLVEVGEPLGRSETDLDPIILDKRRPEAALSPPSARYPLAKPLAVPHGYGPIPQAQQKSLTAVLGARQGPIGRARLPSRSPFEQRQVRLQQPRDLIQERSTKRQKRCIEKENVAHTADSRAQMPSNETGSNHEGQSATPLSALHINKSSTSLRRRSADLSAFRGSGDSDHRTKAAVPKSDLSRAPPTRASKTVSKGRLNEEKYQSTSSAASNPQMKEGPSFTLATLQNTDPSYAHNDTDDIPSIIPSARGTTTRMLHFSREPRRCKLMCEGSVLPIEQSLVDMRNRQGNAKRGHQLEEDQTSHKRRSARRKLRKCDSIINLNNDDQGTESTTVQTSLCDMRQSSLQGPPSPLFVSQTSDLTDLNPSPSPRGIDFQPPTSAISPDRGMVHDLSASSPLKPDACPTAESPKASAVNALLEVACNLSSENPRSVHQTPHRTCSNRKSSPRPSPGHRPFRRIVSESDSNLQQQDPIPCNSHAFDVRNDLASAMQQMAKPLRSSVSIQRSISDTTHLRHTTERAGREVPAVVAVEAYFEPWSEPEAYLLFDWWPPDRKKPSFVTA